MPILSMSASVAVSTKVNSNNNKINTLTTGCIHPSSKYAYGRTVCVTYEPFSYPLRRFFDAIKPFYDVGDTRLSYAFSPTKRKDQRRLLNLEISAKRS